MYSAVTSCPWICRGIDRAELRELHHRLVEVGGRDPQRERAAVAARGGRRQDRAAVRRRRSRTHAAADSLKPPSEIVTAIAPSRMIFERSADSDVEPLPVARPITGSPRRRRGRRGKVPERRCPVHAAAGLVATLAIDRAADRAEVTRPAEASSESVRRPARGPRSRTRSPGRRPPRRSMPVECDAGGSWPSPSCAASRPAHSRSGPAPAA